MAEKCSGSGDCKKSELTGGTMCPSFMATRKEKDSTRARANILRQYLTNSPQNPQKEFIPNQPPISAEVVKEVLDLCLSCKGCKTECPSSVDVGKMKAEFTQQYYENHPIPQRTKLIAHFSKQMKLASIAPWAFNGIFGNSMIRKQINRLVGFHPNRTMPKLNSITVTKWHKNRVKPTGLSKKVFLFCDEFTDYNDFEVGRKAILLLEHLGYEVIIPKHVDSGRSYLSKGLVKEAQQLAIKNVSLLKDVVSSDHPLIGLEPSAILSFRDEYLDLMPSDLRKDAQLLSQNTFLFEEFIAHEIAAKRITSNAFTAEERLIKIHGHCHQKALSNMSASKKALSLPKNYKVQLIPSGCCGMAGSFGYEQEHYDVSMQIGELVLFPTVRLQADEVMIAAAGTSCRHQIKDGTGRKTLHPAEILWAALL